jgi:hypothetical protein
MVCPLLDGDLNLSFAVFVNYLSCTWSRTVIELLSRHQISNSMLVEKRLLLLVIFQWLDQGRELPLSPGASVEFRHRKLHRLTDLRCVLVDNLRSNRGRIRICKRVHGDHTANCQLLRSLVACLARTVGAKHKSISPCIATIAQFLDHRFVVI